MNLIFKFLKCFIILPMPLEINMNLKFQMFVYRQKKPYDILLKFLIFSSILSEI